MTMDSRLLDHYNRELQHLRDMAGEFAADFPKIAGRLGLDAFECADPYVERLLEGFAFLAARVQLKFDSGYTRFTQHLLETVYPALLAPLPSMAIAQFEPDLRNPALAAGALVARASPLRARVAPDEQTSCEFRTAHAVTLWPLALREASYLARPGEIAALALPLPAATTARAPQAALRLVFDIGAGLRGHQLALDTLSLFLRGGDHLPARLYEQLHGHALGFAVRPLAPGAAWQGWRDARHLRAPGFGDDEALLPPAPRTFSGHRLLQEYFAFPSRFHFVELTGLRDALRRCDATAFEVVILLARTDGALERAVDASAFALHCTPVVNLFPKRADRVLLGDRDTEHHIVADRTRPLDFEVHSVTGVVGHGGGERQRFLPFYAMGARGGASQQGWYTISRTPRRVSAAQRRQGARSGYLGSEAWIGLVDADESPLRGEVRELALDTLCTNRDLPILMPVSGSDDFRLEAAAPLAGIRCLKGPTLPLPPHADGELHWRLINLLSLNTLGFLGDDAAAGAAALRDLLGVHAAVAPSAVARQIAGLRSVGQRPVHRRIPAPGPIVFGRGLEITLDCEEEAFEGSGAFLFGAVLEQFFARHVTLNSFTETVLRSTRRGELMRWPTRIGGRQAC
jgi:type VI secretion system protein ImpG